MSRVTIKLLILSLGLVIFAGAVAAYIFYTQEKNGQAIKDSLHRLEVWESLRQVGSEQTELVKEQEAKEKLRSLVLASESDTVSFLAMIDQLAARTGTTITVNSLEIKKTKEVGFDNLEAGFLVVGDTTAVETMVQVFESLPYVSAIESLSLNRGNDSKSSLSLTLLVSVRE